MKEVFFFQGNGCSLFGCLHCATETSSHKDTGIVFCPAFAEEHMVSHRLMHNFAEILAAEGYPILRFDFMGFGDSEGESEECTFESLIANIHAAVDEIKSRTKVRRVGLLGLRLGGTLAALAVERLSEVGFLVLCEPVAKGDSYMKDCLRANIAAQMTAYKKVIYTREQMVDDFLAGKVVNVNGYKISGEFYRQASAMDLTRLKVAAARPVLIVHLSKKEAAKVPEALSRICENYCSAETACSLQTVREEPFWGETKFFHQRAENLFAATTNWLAGLAL